MVNHPHRAQVRLSLTIDEAEALVDVLNFAKRLGYHPMTEYGRDNVVMSLVSKAEAARAEKPQRPMRMPRSLWDKLTADGDGK